MEKLYSNDLHDYLVLKKLADIKDSETFMEINAVYLKGNLHNFGLFVMGKNGVLILTSDQSQTLSDSIKGWSKELPKEFHPLFDKMCAEKKEEGPEM